MKKYFSGLITGLIIATAFAALAVSFEAVQVSYPILIDGVEWKTDKPIVAIDDSTYLPLRAVAQALNVKINWNEELSRVEIGETPDDTIEKVKTMRSVTVDKADAKKPIVTIVMENDSVIKAELYPEIAPVTVENFLKLIEEGFYNGLIFHRIVPGFVIQGGDPTGTGAGGSGKAIKGEFTENGFENNLNHTRGVLSMARASEYDSASSQFFIMIEAAPHLDGSYAAFGKVIEGIEAVDEMERLSQ